MLCQLIKNLVRDTCAKFQTSRASRTDESKPLLFSEGGGGKVVTYISLVYLRYVLSRAERYFFGYVILVASRKILLDGNRVSRCRDLDDYV